MAVAIRQKIGFYTLRKLAYQMCKYLTLFSPGIRATFPENTVLLAALTAAEVACHELVTQIDAQRIATFPP